MSIPDSAFAFTKRHTITLCRYADNTDTFIELLEKLDEANALEEKMIAIRFAHEHNLNITQDAKLEL